MCLSLYHCVSHILQSFSFRLSKNSMYPRYARFCTPCKSMCACTFLFVSTFLLSFHELGYQPDSCYFCMLQLYVSVADIGDSERSYGCRKGPLK